MDTTRLETFSDGVFAIAATLLIIEVSVKAEGDELGHALVHAWPQYAAYVISFVTIGIIWVNHHVLFAQIGKVDRRFLFINVFFLMGVAFIPFPTHVLAEHLQDDGAQAAALAYGLTLTITAFFFVSLWLYAARGRRLIAAEADQRTVSGITRSFIPGVPSYTVATLSSLVSATLAVTLYAALAAFYVLESSLFGRAD